MSKAAPATPWSQGLNIKMAGVTDPGVKRENNEDNILLAPENGIAIVADGMGGHNCGEVASKLAIDTCSQFLIAGLHIEEKDNETFSTAQPLKELLYKAIQQANQKIRKSAQENDKQSGMGTTFVGIMFRKNWFVIGNVGDSRCYRWRNDELSQLSVDHSWVQGLIKKGEMNTEDAKHSPQRGLLLQALGNKTVEPSFTSGCPLPGDVYLLCSDGLTEPVTDEIIAKVLAQDDKPRLAAHKLVALANKYGGPDNISVIIIKVKEASD